ncbi:molecular chaperone [Sulfurisphaera ohwakuensis]|uniref:TorD/DmsD family molecular chaperone n=1 Tax=Sulfurisphaera ohwakuensis TaxID=69656 RepID=UPI0036F395DF
MWVDYKLFSYLLLGPRFNYQAESLLGGILEKPYYKEVENIILMVKQGEYDKLATEYTSCFINDYPRLLCPPYESWYKERSVYGSSALEVADIYNKYGIRAVKSLPDHVAVEFEFTSFLYNIGEVENAEKFIIKHILTWVPQLANDMIAYSKGDYIRALGKTLLNFIKYEKNRLHFVKE